MDLQHGNNQYFKDGRQYKDNVWEYFFEQPDNVSLNDLTNDSNIIICSNTDLKNFDFDFDINNIEKTRAVFKPLGQTSYNKEMKKYLDEMYRKTIGNETEVLGILCRGTDYVMTRPYGHKIQPTPDTVIKKARELLNKYNYKKIWLATEDMEIYKKFKNEFGDMIIDNFQYKFSRTENLYLADYPLTRENHFYNLGKEYLASMYILSKCKYFIGGLTAGVTGCFLLSNGFKNQSYVYLWDLGLYGIKKPVIYHNKMEKVFSIKNEYFENKKHKVVTLLGIKFKLFSGKIKTNNMEMINA